MTQAVLVTGTDTGCGKTTVACALARSAVEQDLRVHVLKPVETGCENGVAADAVALARAAGDDRPIEALCPYRLALPAAPDVAAPPEGVHIERAVLEKAFAEARQDADLVLVEGAGGLLVPITDSFDMAALATALDLPLIVVARAALGTMNHTLLTLEAAAARNLRVTAVAISHVEADLSQGDRQNLDYLLAKLPVPYVELQHGDERCPQLARLLRLF